MNYKRPASAENTSKPSENANETITNSSDISPPPAKAAKKLTQLAPTEPATALSPQSKSDGPVQLTKLSSANTSIKSAATHHPAPAPNVTGIACKAKKLGPTGWVEVTTTTGLKYYVSKTLNITTWVCPPEASTWLMRRDEEIKRSKEAKARKEEAKKQLEAEDAASEYIRIFEQLITSLKIPPILTYERAVKRMLQNTRFQSIPIEAREEAFKKARSNLLGSVSTQTGSASDISSVGISGLIKQFQSKLEQLQQNKRLRADHQVEEVMSLFFSDERWLPIRQKSSVVELVHASLGKLQEERRAELDQMRDDMKLICVKYFPNYLEETKELSGKSLKDLLMDDVFAVSFLDASNMSSFVKYLRDSLLTLLSPAERAIFMRFAALSDTDDMLGMVAEAWQTLCQSVWTNLVSSKKRENDLPDQTDDQAAAGTR